MSAAVAPEQAEGNPQARMPMNLERILKDFLDVKGWPGVIAIGVIAFLVSPELGLLFVIGVLIYLAFKSAAFVLRTLSEGIACVSWGIRDLAGIAQRSIEWRPSVRPRPLRAPTAEELAAAAMDRYKRRLRLLARANLDEIELSAGCERAKQQYVRELDEILR